MTKKSNSLCEDLECSRIVLKQTVKKTLTNPVPAEYGTHVLCFISLNLIRRWWLIGNFLAMDTNGASKLSTKAVWIGYALEYTAVQQYVDFTVFQHISCFSRRTKRQQLEDLKCSRIVLKQIVKKTSTNPVPAEYGTHVLCFISLNLIRRWWLIGNFLAMDINRAPKLATKFVWLGFALYSTAGQQCVHLSVFPAHFVCLLWQRSSAEALRLTLLPHAEAKHELSWKAASFQYHWYATI